jgi:succinylarginine dihydrolase
MMRLPNHTYYEVNFEGLIGPTHNYSGLSYGNLASMSYKDKISNPRAAALQGLEKMLLLHKLGVRQAILPPQERPHLPTIRSLGFSGTDQDSIIACAQQAPQLFYQLSSAAAMWTANAATVTPSCDSSDGRVHFTPANLTTKLHRCIEAPFTTTLLKRIFTSPKMFSIHSALPSHPVFADEGAANHCRLCYQPNTEGTHLFVYGYNPWEDHTPRPQLYPARYSSSAAEAIARRHHLKSSQVVYAQQNPFAIDAGVFHNDLVAINNNRFLICHEEAFIDTLGVCKQLKEAFFNNNHQELQIHLVSSQQLMLTEAVESYFFNSQLITLPEVDGGMALITASECREHPRTRTLINDLLQDPAIPITAVHYTDLHESMHNGGGPACLRLRVILNTAEINNSHSSVYFTTELYQQLKNWIEAHYRDRLHPSDLIDPQFLIQTQAALDTLTKILQLDNLYSFQQMSK